MLITRFIIRITSFLIMITSFIIRITSFTVMIAFDILSWFEIENIEIYFIYYVNILYLL